MAGFERTLDELFVQAAPQSLLDVGCGEGVLDAQVGPAPGRPARRRHRPRRPGAPRRVGEAPGAEPRVPGHEGREPPVRRRRVRRRDARSRCSSTCPTPSTPSPRWPAWRSAGCSSRCPREPLWRGLNMARGAYLQGPRQHARATSTTGPSARSWRCCRGTARSSRPARRSRGRCCSSAFVTETAVPSADETAGAPQADGYARGARILSIGIASTGVVTFAYFAVASHVARRAATTARSRCCGRCCS